MSKSLIWCEVVDSDDVDICVSKGGTEEVTSDATKTIDSDINHESVLATSGALPWKLFQRAKKCPAVGGSKNCHNAGGLGRTLPVKNV